MSSGEYRRSMRIIELEARKVQKAVNKKKLDMGVDNTEGQSSRRNRRKKAKVNHASSKATNSGISGEAFAVPSRTPLPQSSSLETLLDILKRRDMLKIFAEPVNSAEVEGYDNVVKDPMDFATISTKLSRGKYKMLEEFEHDVFLVFSNAMLFNDSKTIYYRQARAIREVAKKLFAALRTDASNFETEFSLVGQAMDGWTKAEARLVNSNSCNQRKNVTTTGKGSSGASQSECLERRSTYKPPNSYHQENIASISTVLNAPGSAKTLVQINQSSLGYGQNICSNDSLLKFTRGLGPVALRVAQRKLDRCYYGSFIGGHVPLHHELRVCNHQRAPWASSPGSWTPSPVYQNPSGNPARPFDQYPVPNKQHQQVPCTISPGSGKLRSVYKNPFGSPVRVRDHNANAEKDDFYFGDAPTSNGGNPSVSDGMSFDDFLIYLRNL